MNSSRSIGSVTSALKSQWIVVVLIVGIGLIAAGLAVRVIPAKYAATATVLMVADPPDSEKRQVQTAATKPLLTADLPSLATSANVLARFRHDIGSTEDLETLRSRIRAKVSTDSNIMPVQYIAKNETAAINGTNALADEISQSYRQLATTRFDSLIRDLNGQISARRSQLILLDGRLQAVAQDYPYVDVGGAQSSGGERPGSVYSRMIELRAERDELMATVQSDSAMAASSGRYVEDATPLAMREVVDTDPVYRDLHDQYAKDVAQLRHLESFATDTYPGLADLRSTVQREASQVAQARAHAEESGPRSNGAYAQALDIQAKSESQLAGDQAKLTAVDGELSALNAKLGRTGIATNAALIRRDRETVELAYSTLSERLAQANADRAEASSTGSVIVMDHAQYAEQSTITSGAVVGTAMVAFAIWLAVTLAVLLDGSRERRRSPSAVETIYRAPILGQVA